MAYFCCVECETKLTQDIWVMTFLLISLLTSACVLYSYVCILVLSHFATAAPMFC